MVVGLVPGLIIGLREGVEAALVVGIILAYLSKIGQRSLQRYVYLGSAVAIGASVAAAALFAALFGEFEGTAEQLFEGVAALLAVVVLTSMIFWMMKAAKNIRKHVEQRIDLLVDRRHVMGLASLAFIAVFREGVETVLFMAGLTGVATTADIVAGVGIGILLAAFLGFGLFRASWKINLKRFFQVTGVFLIVIAAGLFQLGVHELQEANHWGLDGQVYNTKFVDTNGNAVWDPGEPAILPDKLPEDGSVPSAAQVAGALLRGIVGYNDDPTQLELVAYGLYWALTLVVYWGIRTGRIDVVTHSLRRLWGLIRRSPEPSSPEPRAD
jgi:high-affinity iron transporter